MNKCEKCFKTFTDISNLRKHVKKCHPDEIQSLGKYKKLPDNYSYTCNCGKHFSHKRHFSYHLKTHNEDSTNIDNKSKKCPLCEHRSSFQNNLLVHLEKTHHINIEMSTLKFATMEDFKIFVNTVENKTKSCFVKKMSTTKSIKYECNRSGMYSPVANRQRILKTQGTNKINGFCPASLTLKINEEGNYHCIFVETHVGHTNDIGHLFLGDIDRQQIAEKIALHIPFNVILDEVRDSIDSSNLYRLHLLTKKDLYNIEHSYNLRSQTIRHSNDAISVDSWVNEMSQGDNPCVLYYKPQDTLCDKYTQLKKEDFILIIMNLAQSDMIKKFGSDCICLDGTHGVNGYNFELITLLVIDDMRQGFPCAFMITSRTDKETLKIFFLNVKQISDLVKPKVFMTDIAESFYNAWIEIMGLPSLRLYCSWHVDRAWRKNLTKIKNKEKQVVVYKQIRSLMEERDSSAFTLMKNELCKQLLEDPDTTGFAEYFINNYIKNCQSWAFCYRLHSGLNTNMHLERMHRTLKYIYLNGKHVKRLDKAISGIMKFIRDRFFDRLIILNKGKITNKLKDIRNRHKNSLQLNTELVIKTENGWQVMSSSPNTLEVYLVQNIKNNCTCQLICSECNGICLHMFSCSCPDSSIKWIMCKHIHLVCRKDNLHKGESIISEVENNNPLYIQEDNVEAVIESENIVNNLGKTRISTEESLDNEKVKLLQQLTATVSDIRSVEELDLFRKTVAPFSPTLEALRNSKQNNQAFLAVDKKIPSNKKIVPQRRLYSTKKVKTTRRNSIQKPTVKESQNIAIRLLNKKSIQ